MKASTRRFSKRLVAVNVALAWGAVYLSIVYLQASYVASVGMAFIATVAGAYMGVGHMDMRAYVRSVVAGQQPAAPADYPAPLPPEPQREIQ